MEPLSPKNMRAASEVADIHAQLVELREKYLILQKENVRLEKAFVEVEEKFRLIFEHSPIGEALTQMNGYLIANKAFCNILGYP